MDEQTYPWEPDYCLVSKSDLAMVLTVYEDHTPEEARPYCPWYLRCKEALNQPTPVERPQAGVTDESLLDVLGIEPGQKMAGGEVDG